MSWLGTESDNFGDDARELRGNVVMGRGRGRGRPRQTEDRAPIEVPEKKEQVAVKSETGIKETEWWADEAANAAIRERDDAGVLAQFSYMEPDIIPCTLVKVPSSTTSGKSVPKKSNVKTNGYCLFMQHMGRETGTKGSINELMGMFDKDWKMLPEEEKKMWKTRAKTGWKPDFRKTGTGAGKRREGAPPFTQGQGNAQPTEQDDEYGEGDDEFY